MIFIKGLSALREYYQNENKRITYHVISDKDINGGKDFEEVIREVWISKGQWEIRQYTEATIQPDFGRTISRKRDEGSRIVSDEQLGMSYVNGELSILELDDIIKEIMKTIKVNRL